ncbi:MAG: PilZ domain-containing protein [Marinagarivorans sp.]|nr:PilZ domain-containing protein [Marinagarivorans sp.]
MSTTPSDRREFFRVDDDVIFDVQPVDSETAHKSDPNDYGDGPTWEILEALAAIDHKTQQAASKLSPENYTYLNLLNTKVDLIARHTVFSHYQHLPKTRISLCEDGIAFKNPRMLYKGSFVQMRIIFLPRFVPIITFAQIIRCESRENSYNVAAKFFRLDTRQQQLIAQTLIKAQQQSTSGP